MEMGANPGSLPMHDVPAMASQRGSSKDRARAELLEHCADQMRALIISMIGEIMTTENEKAVREAFDKWADSYGLQYEPGYSKLVLADCFAAWQAALSTVHTQEAECLSSARREVSGEAVAWMPITDVQWVNIVNHENCWNGYSKDDAVSEAVKLTEAKCRENNALQSQAGTPPAEREGWKLVPVEPTGPMLEAGRELHPTDNPIPRTIYKAMLAAAPTPPHQQEQTGTTQGAVAKVVDEGAFGGPIVQWYKPQPIGTKLFIAHPASILAAAEQAALVKAIEICDAVSRSAPKAVEQFHMGTKYCKANIRAITPTSQLEAVCNEIVNEASKYDWECLNRRPEHERREAASAIVRRVLDEMKGE